MKKIYFIVFLFFSLYSVSQTWPQPGAIWHYKNNNPIIAAGYKVGITEFKFTNTITVNSIVCSHIAQTFTGVVNHPTNTPVTQTLFPYIVYTSNDVYYVYDSGANIFDTLVDLNASVGNKWLIPFGHGCNNGDYVTVTGTGTISLNNLTLKKLTITANSAFGTFTNTIVERIAGFDDYFLPYGICVTDYPTPPTFMCYEDNNFLLYKKPNVTNCFYDVSLNEFEKLNSIYPSPNPFNDQLIINSQLKDLIIDRLEIINTLGQKVFFSKQQKVNEPIQVDLPKGIYILNLEVNGQSRSYKIIRE